MLLKYLTLLGLSHVAIAIPIDVYPSANFKLGVPLYTQYQDDLNGVKFGAITIDINLTISNIEQEGERNFTWITFQYPSKPEDKLGEPIWNMSCMAMAKKGFEGVAEFTLKDAYPWITAGVNASGVRDGTSGIQCPEGKCVIFELVLMGDIEIVWLEDGL
ncbi:hypothetical protein L486_05041 [Kwoniella mangroviensis CBS 10435]|uniref:Phosphatidylglycerol/phosphatidylinositol transfer protein n=1 Tax=Kwoniella mangroviensis CBS 10435 TaxID=1331196 RepID=A0A1B9IPX2_9TREE|nr:uncharacterized protein I203_00222 [Kwoniella mangroviensis CBS 8507]OCF57582.1 hypothetical protein L486_05041 [Kwoniella mangroviensis CBS 10435]OCF70091.1 hypothetical protein I203_00222 [Kwoniella mangroviensis CBS 8507]